MSADGGPVARHSPARAAVRENDTVRSSLEPAGAPEPIGSMLARNAARFGEKAAVRHRSGEGWSELTWARLALDAARLARFMEDAGLRAGERAAVISRNRAEMIVTELAVMGLGAVYVPIFAGYGTEEIGRLLEHAAPRVLFAGGPEELEKVPLDRRPEVVVDYSGRASGGAVPFAEALARAAFSDPGDAEVRRFLERAAAVDPFEPCLMMYTSGTTGRQKGVLLTHDNMLSQQRALSMLWDVSENDRFLSYLPWHHSFGGIFEKTTALYNGALLTLDDSLGKDFDRLLENWKEVKPTVYFSVPKVYQQLYDHVVTHPEQEREVFHEELRFVFTAAAPLPESISRFFADRKIPVLEGWGLTETSPCCTITDMAESRSIPGVVGYPIPGVAIRIAEDGEILVRGPNVMRGYFRDEEATRKALPGDGWFHTGDLGEFYGKALKLVSRKDRVFKLLNAEKVVPTLLENKLAGMNPYIRHVIVVGSGQDFLAALIFPNYYLIRERFGDDIERAEREVRESLRKTIEAFNAEHPVKYERIRAFAVVSRELTVDDEELTPSLKVRVKNVLDRNEPVIDAIYDPSSDCDCRFLRKVFRLVPDSRKCFLGKDKTLDQCHTCGRVVFAEGAPGVGEGSVG
ncbi:MAG: hypothetical protein D6718_10800 [Acidobacteria bacterium]|nr:MAG: hypothetical protein D6718_10800 [Acidobacteriota bacterium]